MGAKPGCRLEDEAEEARLMQSHPCRLLGTNPCMWPFPNLAQAGFGKILSGMYQTLPGSMLTVKQAG